MNLSGRFMGRDVTVWGRNAVVGTSFEELYSYDQALSWPAILAAATTVDISSSSAQDAFFVSKGTATMTIAAPCVVTLSTHTLATGDAVKFTTTGALPTGLTASKTYYAKVINANTFNLHLTRAAAIAGTDPITTTGTQSGTHTLFIPGTGANTITIFGLDANFNLQEENVNMNGTTVVTSAKSYRRFFGAEVLRAGSGLVNAGDIHIIKTGTSAVYTTPGVPDTLTSALCKVLIGYGTAGTGMYTVPAGKTASFKGLIANARSQPCTFVLVSQQLGDTEANSLRTDYPVEVTTTGGVVISASDVGAKLCWSEKTDIRIRVLAAGAGGIAVGVLSLIVE